MSLFWEQQRRAAQPHLGRYLDTGQAQCQYDRARLHAKSRRIRSATAERSARGADILSERSVRDRGRCHRVGGACRGTRLARVRAPFERGVAGAGGSARCRSRALDHCTAERSSARARIRRRCGVDRTRNPDLDQVMPRSSPWIATAVAPGHCGRGRHEECLRSDGERTGVGRDLRAARSTAAVRRTVGRAMQELGSQSNVDLQPDRMRRRDLSGARPACCKRRVVV